MPPAQDSDQTTESTLTKLLEVDSELAVTETQLLAQLESVQEKRRSLKTVLNLFTKVDTPATAPIEEPVQIPEAETGRALKPVSSDSAAPPLETSPATETVELETEASPDTESEVAEKTAPSPNRRNKTKQVTHRAKAAKISSGWQDYVREEFSNASLPKAIAFVLQRQADEVLETSAIVSAIFVDETPKSVVDKARRQVTNILANGVRHNKWYRGQLGYYSMSRAAAEANAVWRL